MRSTREYTTSNIVTGFARFGVPLETIACAMVVPVDQVEVIARRAKERGEIEMLPPRCPKDTRSALQSEVANLRAALSDVQYLLAEIGNKKIADYMNYLGANTRFTRHEAMIVNELARDGRVSKERLYFALYGSDVGEAPMPKIIDVFICKLRKKLPHNVTVDTVWGHGYEMTATSRRNLQVWSGLPVIESPSLCPSEQAA